MYDIWKSIFGIPPNGDQGYRTNDELPNNLRDIPGGRNEDEENENPRIHFEDDRDIFGFPSFTHHLDVHKYFESIINEMHKKFENFGLQEDLGITWEENKDCNSEFCEKPRKSTESLRDAFLKKPGYINSRNVEKEDIDLDGRIKLDEVENILRHEPDSFRNANSIIQSSTPKGYSKSVYIRTVINADGSTETIKKVRDHTGKEETTITQNSPSDVHPPPNNQLLPKDDISGISIFKKFFPF